MLKRLVTMGICCALIFFMAGCGAKEEENYEEQAANSEAGYRRTVLYYQADSGHIVPVMKLIPWEEGIGKAALSYLVGTEGNELAASAMGLKTVLPQGVEFSLRIGNGDATLDIANLPDFEDAKSEQAMVTAVVNTLTEFSTINTVQITLDGKHVRKMANGTDLSKSMSAIALNVEDGEVSVSSGNAHAMTLYFSNARATLNVPVTRYVEAEPTFADSVSALMQGPQDETLMNCFPEGTVLNSACISEGIASIDLSKEFCGVEDTEGLLQVAQDTLYLTANAFEEVYGVDIYVDGEAYSTHVEAASAPVYVNQFR